MISKTQTLGMMAGELDADDFLIFGDPSDNKTSSPLFITFIIIVNIVIANLLVGLAITEMGKVFVRAEIMRLERTTYLLQEIQAGRAGNFLYDKRVHSFFKYLEKSSGEKPYCYKICVLPNSEKHRHSITHIKGEGYRGYKGYRAHFQYWKNMITKFATFNPNVMASESLYNVYAYDENYPKPLAEKLLPKITIPARILNKAIEILKKRNEVMDVEDGYNIMSSGSIDNQIVRRGSHQSFKKQSMYLKSRSFVKRLNSAAQALNMSPIRSGSKIPNAERACICGKCECGNDILESNSTNMKS